MKHTILLILVLITNLNRLFSQRDKIDVDPIFKSALQESLYHYVSGIKNFLESGRLVHDQFDLFLHETARQDCATNSNFNIGNLRLYSILTETDQQLYHQHPRLDLLPNDQRIVYTQHSPL